MESNHDALLSLAREQFHRHRTEEQEIREEALKDLRFVAGDQWDEKDARERRESGRPVLSFNKLPAHIQQVANEARQNKPQIKYAPVDDGADKETASILEGLSRHIQYSSDADVAYETALYHSAAGSFGYFRYLTQYCNDETFDLELITKTVSDPAAVYGVLIPSILGQKVRNAFVVETITRDEFKSRFGEDVEPASIAMDTPHVSDWCLGDRVQIAEYWWVETERHELHLIEYPNDDGTLSQMTVSKLPEGFKSKRKRIVTRDVVKTCLIDGVQILEPVTTWPGSTIPIIAVTGQALIVDGKPRLFSLIRFSRDPQQLINVSKSRIAETLGLSPISPWIAEAGQVEDFAAEWREAHKKPVAVLRYKGVSVGGQYAPAPHRQVYEPPIAALSNFVLQETQDIKESTSIYDSSLGSQGNETSGIAIRRRQQQSSLSNFHFIDNLARAHRAGGRIIAEVVPVIYDTDRQVRILGEDESQKIVRVNTEWQDPETGKVHTYNLTTGKYDVTVVTGPGYTTKRQEAFELLTQLAQASPDLMAIGGDVILGNSDIPGADILAKRFKKRLPPELLEEEDGDQAPQIPPQVQGQLQQMQQVIQQLTQAVHAAHDQLEGKQIDLQSRERIEMEKIQLERERMIMQAEIERLKLGSREAEAELKARLQVAGAELQADRERERFEIEQENQRRQAEQAAESEQSPAEMPQAA